MNKFILTFLLAVVALFGNAQRPDSVYLNNEWRYIYPADEPIHFEYKYYANYGLDIEQYLVWVEWKMKNDPRANLELDQLFNAIELERFHRLEIIDSVLTEVEMKNSLRSAKRGLRKIRSQKYQRKYPETNYDLELKYSLTVPPVVQELPNGKYVQYFMPYASINNRKSATIDSTLIACFFELKENELDGRFLRLDPKGDTLALGQFVQGFKNGFWYIVTNKSVSVPYNTFFHPNPKPLYIEDHSETNYLEGNKHGETRTYARNRLSTICNYENGVPSGLYVSVWSKDSIVYDASTEFRIQGHQLGLEKTPYMTGESLRNHISGGHESYKEMRKADRYSQTIFHDLTSPGTGYGYTYPSAADSIYLDSLFNKNKSNYYASKKYPVFKSFYRVYDRESKQLVYERLIDSKTMAIHGSTYYPNGAILDTIWTEPKTMNTRIIIRDERGRVLYLDTMDQVETKPTTVMIDGFEATQFGVGKDIYYSYSTFKAQNDTIYRSIRWNKDKIRVSCRYDVLSTATQDIILQSPAGDNYKLLSNENYRVESYKKGDLEFVNYHSFSSGEDSSALLLNGQPFKGVVKYRLVKKDPKLNVSKNKLKLYTTSNDYLDFWEDENISKYKASSRIVKDVMEDQLQIDVYGVYLIKGNHGSQGFDGEVKIKTSDTKDFTLNYIAGEPNGRIELYEDEYVYPREDRDFGQHNLALGTKKFGHSILGLPYVRSAYNLVNGKVDGPLIYYTSAGDTTACFMYKNGIKEGKFFQYSISNRAVGEFKNNKLVGNLKIEGVFAGEYITVVEATFDQNGKVISARQNALNTDGDAYLKQEINLSVMPDGKYFLDAVENGEPLAKWIIEKSYCVENKYFNGKFPSYSLRYDSTRMEHRLDLPSFLNNYYLGSDGLSFSGGESSGRHDIDAFLYTDEPSFDRSDYNDSTYFTKYYPNDKIAREGYFMKGKMSYSKKKYGEWKAYSYNGNPLHHTFYKDSICQYAGENWKVIGFQTEFDSLGKTVAKRWLIEELETYECSSDEYYAERQYITISSSKPEQMNGWCKNYYDNGSLMNEGNVVNGVPDGLWKFYAPDGKLNRLGRYSNGKTDGRWLYGDLSEKAYIGEMCIDPDSDHYAVIVHNLEKDKEVEVRVYKKGVLLSTTSYGGDRDIRYDNGIRSDIQLR